MVEFRIATLEDFGRLLDFKRDIHSMHVEHAPNFYRAVQDPLTHEELRDMAAGKDGRAAYVLVDSGRLTAYAFTRMIEITRNPTIFDQKILFVDDMYVEGKARRKGYGRRLMNELKHIAADKGCGSISLEVWEWNKEAIAFYEALGLRPTQVRMKLWM